MIVSGCWQGISRIRLYEEVGWESLSSRRWARRMTMFYKIMNGSTPSYLHERVPEKSAVNMAVRRRNINTPSCRMERYANSFFLIV